MMLCEESMECKVAKLSKMTISFKSQINGTYVFMLLITTKMKQNTEKTEVKPFLASQVFYIVK